MDFATTSPQRHGYGAMGRFDRAGVGDGLRPGNAPHPVAFFAITLVVNEPEKDAQMQQDGGQKEFARHLWVIHFQ